MLGVGAPNLAVYGGLLVAVVTAIIAIRRFPLERRGLLITNEQGAAQLRDAHIEALQRDLQRKEDELERKDRRIASLEDQLEACRAERDGMRRRFGTRAEDPEDGAAG